MPIILQLLSAFTNGKNSPSDIQKYFLALKKFYAKTEVSTIGEELYQQVYNSFINFYKYNHTHFQSLVDWGDNGVISGEYITVINTPLNSNVNI